MNSSSKSTKLPLRELVILSLMAALTFGAKVGMSFLPNIEPVTLLLAVTALVYGKKALYTCYVYVLLEGLVYGFGLWWVGYLYAWALWIVIVLILKKSDSYAVLTIAAGIFGLCFGALFSIPYLFVGGVKMAVSYWVAGIAYDLLHAAGNAVLCGLLLKPLHKTVQKLAQ